ncbi:MAG TPA: metallopeptidase TldD-related protein [Planctomycetota bacterium]|nr:metallopeptidase TldD-related protein [Planctomycetota bacterium]
MDSARARRLAEVALSASGADATEVTIAASEQALNRFTHEHPVQNVARQEVSIAVRVHEGGRQGKASTGTPTEEAVRRTVERARAAARLAPAQELAPMPGPPAGGVGEDGGYRLRGGGPLPADPEATAAAVGRVAEAAREAGCRATGIHHGLSTLRLVANSAGLLVHDWDTVAQVSVSAFQDDGAGWAFANGATHERLDAADVARRAVHKAVASRAARAVPPGRYTVVLEPAAVSSLLLFTASHGFGAQQVLDGCSFLCGRLGEPVFGGNVSVADDAFHPLTVGPVFDGVGMPRQRVTLVEGGVARSLVHDQVTARRAGCASTGHAQPQPSRDGPYAGNLVLEPGEGSADLIRGVRRGLLVTQFHYSNVVEPTKLTLTGMTRNGTFLIEDGEIVGPVKNMRYTESLVEAFQRVSAIGGDPTLASALFGGWAVVPSVRIEEFGFSSGTEF